MNPFEGETERLELEKPRDDAPALCVAVSGGLNTLEDGAPRRGAMMWLKGREVVGICCVPHGEKSQMVPSLSNLALTPSGVKSQSVV